MAQRTDEEQLRGAIASAASLAGVRVELVEGEAWSVEHSVVRIGVDSFEAGASSDEVAARVLLIVWESVREVRVAPLRRSRRKALAAQHPELEPALALIDRLLSAAEILVALPGMRASLAHVLLTDVQGLGAIGERPRHLQWLACVLLLTAWRWIPGAPAETELLGELAPEVVTEVRRLARIGGDGVEGAGVVQLAIVHDAQRTPLQRFERAYGLLVPPYVRLLASDVAERGLSAPGTRSGADDSVTGEVDAAGTAGGGSADDAQPGGDADDAASDGASEQAREGDQQEAAEGADLFAAEQAGFVQTVLSTPLPADGAWEANVDLPEIEAVAGENDPPSAPRGGGPSGQSLPARPTELTEYRARVHEHEASIAAVREVWRSIIAERIGERRSLARIPEPWGETLDRGSLAQIIAEATAGVERPRAFVSLQRYPRRTRRSGSTDYVLLIDRSASMRGAPAESAATAAMVMLESLAGVARDIHAEEQSLGIDLDLALRTALIVFDTTPLVVKPLAGALDDSARRRVHAEIRSPRGSTNDAAALRMAASELGIDHAREVQNGAGVERRRVVIFVSDGGTDDGGRAAQELGALRRAGVAVFGIGIRTSDVAHRFAPNGIRLDDPAALAPELERLIVGAGLSR